VGDGRGAGATLGEEERARVRALPWFGAALARLESMRQRRAGMYQASVSEKVDWLCRLWPGEAAPKHGEKRLPQQEWLPAGVALETVPPLDGGALWSNIRGNFVGDGRGALTTLNEEERARVRALP
jgi:hypothetical protein